MFKPEEKELALAVDKVLGDLANAQSVGDIIKAIASVASAVRAELHKDETFTKLIKGEQDNG